MAGAALLSHFRDVRDTSFRVSFLAQWGRGISPLFTSCFHENKLVLCVTSVTTALKSFCERACVVTRLFGQASLRVTCLTKSKRHHIPSGVLPDSSESSYRLLRHWVIELVAFDPWLSLF